MMILSARKYNLMPESTTFLSFKRQSHLQAAHVYNNACDYI